MNTYTCIQAPRRKPGDRPTQPPRGFTLTELLVVIGIMAVLAALITPAVLNARKAARNAAIKAEIDMLHMAIMNYKNEYGSFPPCFATVSASGTDAAARHIRRIFPRLPLANVPTQLQYLNNTGQAAFPVCTAITPSTAIVQWLSGYTADPSQPVLSTNGVATVASGTVTVSGVVMPRKKIFDFDQSRVGTGRNYFPSGKQVSSYIYIDSLNYLNSAGAVQTFADGTNTYFAHRVPLPAAPTLFNNVAQPAFNPDTFQILCAGQDQIFGNDDDMSNFWKGTRKEYLDSL
jgi:prepilin-type N-terminal cleavage/methylation domain-containing protein